MPKLLSPIHTLENQSIDTNSNFFLGVLLRSILAFHVMSIPPSQRQTVFCPLIPLGTPNAAALLSVVGRFAPFGASNPTRRFVPTRPYPIVRVAFWILLAVLKDRATAKGCLMKFFLSKMLSGFYDLLL